MLLSGADALTWTGFPGNTFWDWLELLALPLVVAFLPLWFETHRRLEGRWRAALSLVLTAFVIIVVGGYRLDWTWTGFAGNTVRDWLQLLVVPFVLPATLAWFAARRGASADEAAPAGAPQVALPVVHLPDADADADVAVAVVRPEVDLPSGA